MGKRVESPSSINTFNQCKRKYYYQYIEKLPTTPSIHQVRGNIAHSTLENFYNVDISSFTAENYILKFKESIQKLFVHYWQTYQPELKKLNLNRDQEQFYFEETMLMVMNWVTHIVEDISKMMAAKNISLQEAFMLLTPVREMEYSSPEYSVRGFIDAIHHVGDDVHIIDYKTNAAFEVKNEIRLQLAIYSLLYFEKHQKMPSKVGIFFLRHKLKMLSVDEELLSLAKAEIGKIHTHTVQSEQMDHYPRHVNPLCKWSTGKCDFYDTCKPHG
ncbi:TPA: PD-(D/E)XK nuclease family protein [Candidatus Woesearchaeota archaeon]|nr:PD-(D/E)XK nuclease family protein [Candidatus Woesearchaeota archaeon]